MLGRVNKKYSGDSNSEEMIQYIDGKCSKYEDVTLDWSNELEPGEYIMFVEIDWN
jgi:hypothetical protein